MVYETYSAQETFALGENLAKSAVPSSVYTLEGDLGAGKTVFAQGFAAGLGVRDYVNSPTFTIVQEYTDGRLPLYHFDVYRIEEAEEMYEIGAEEYFYGDGVCLIEWPQRIPEILPPSRIAVTIEKDMEKGFFYRRISKRAAGQNKKDKRKGKDSR